MFYFESTEDDIKEIRLPKKIGTNTPLKIMMNFMGKG